MAALTESAFEKLFRFTQGVYAQIGSEVLCITDEAITWREVDEVMEVELLLTWDKYVHWVC